MVDILPAKTRVLIATATQGGSLTYPVGNWLSRKAYHGNALFSWRKDSSPTEDAPHTRSFFCVRTPMCIHGDVPRPKQQHRLCFDCVPRTEHGCDYMIFYADDTMSKVYGDNKYTGGKDGAVGNWPGMGGRPALEIPASMFFFRWQTDGSVSAAVPDGHRVF